MRLGLPGLPIQIEARLEYDPGDDVEEVPDGELGTWTNVAVTNGTPIRWNTDRGNRDTCEELVGRLVIGAREQLVLDMSGSAVAKMLTVLLPVQQDLGCPGSSPGSIDGEEPAPEGSRADGQR